MKITKNFIKNEFSAAQSSLEFCWDALVDLKEYKNEGQNVGRKIIDFQERLSSTIFRLQSIREVIIKQEKEYVKNKSRYQFHWFESRMKLLSYFKKGIDYVVNISKAIGDAYAYFFYHNDLELLAKHLSHQQIINHASGTGERGELEFVKHVKGIDGHFTLYHGITNILRYGDFSFIDLKTMTVVQIGELKSSLTDPNTLDLKVTLFDRGKLQEKIQKVKNPELEKTRKGRQALDIVNLFINEGEHYTSRKNLVNKSYSNEVGNLLNTARIDKPNFIKVSSGLSFCCIKFRKASVYHRIFKRGNTIQKRVAEAANEITSNALALMKSGSKNNSLILDQLLYDAGFAAKCVPGTVPLFWHPLNSKLLNSIYFTDCIILSLFNPIHLIDEVENLGFLVESNYVAKPNEEKKELKKGIKGFDFFINYITGYLLTESFVTDSLNSVDYISKSGLTQILVKPQQRIDIKDYIPMQSQSNY